MSHGLFDCIGLPLHGNEATAAFVQEHHDELRGVPLADGWFAGRWSDPSGAFVSVLTGPAGELVTAAGFAGRKTTRVANIVSVAADAGTVAMDIVDEQGQQVTRCCADLEHWWHWQETADDGGFEATVTALAQRVAIYDDEAAFSASAGSFIPVGMFPPEQMNPMAQLSGIVEHGWTQTNEATGREFRVAQIRTVDVFTAYLCWPADIAPLAVPGNVIHSHAYLTASIREQQDRARR